jgi:hypothetical protein
VSRWTRSTAVREEQLGVAARPLDVDHGVERDRGPPGQRVAQERRLAHLPRAAGDDDREVVDHSEQARGELSDAVVHERLDHRLRCTR